MEETEATTTLDEEAVEIVVHEVFTHTDLPTPFNVTLAYEWCEKNRFVPHTLPLTPELAEYASDQPTFSMDRLDAICSNIEAMLRPAMAIQMPGGTLLTVDGHHRIVAWSMNGCKTGQWYRLTWEQAQQFFIEAEPEQTTE